MIDSESLLFRRYTKWTFYALAIYVLGLGFSPYPKYFSGLLLGGIFSFILLLTTYRRISNFGRAVANQQKPRSLGTFTRFALVGIAAWIALAFPQYFDMVSMIVGLLTSYIIIFIDILIQAIKIRS